MVSIPTPNTVAVGQAAASADFNSHATAINFWASPPRVRVYASGDRSGFATAGTGAPVPFNGETFDVVPSGWTQMHDASGAPTRLTAPVAGVYQVGYNLTAGSSVAQDLEAWISLNGAQYGGASRLETASGTTYNALHGTELVQCASGDYIEVYVLWGTTVDVVRGYTGASSAWAILVSQ